jgi:hypothetical protein
MNHRLLLFIPALSDSLNHPVAVDSSKAIAQMHDMDGMSACISRNEETRTTLNLPSPIISQYRHPSVRE